MVVLLCVAPGTQVLNRLQPLVKIIDLSEGKGSSGDGLRDKDSSSLISFLEY